LGAYNEDHAAGAHQGGEPLSKRQLFITGDIKSIREALPTGLKCFTESGSGDILTDTTKLIVMMDEQFQGHAMEAVGL
jgi:hypothetical protein